MSNETELEVSTTVQAPPEKIWPLVSDPAGMGRFSPEAVGANYKGGAAGPSLGAKFKGKNRNGWHRWSTDGKITTFDANRAVAWDISFMGFKVARWTYELDAGADGTTTVTERWQDLRIPLLRWPPLGALVTGQKDRPGCNKQGMETSLERIKATAEGSAS
jgi:uncharacterized protein YndB with AHSA1/START domain